MRTGQAAVLVAVGLVVSALPLLVCGVEHDRRDMREVYCDVVIAGGSTASLAAAVSAANVSLLSSSGRSVCLLELTDWLGGQLTSSAVSAIDFGSCNLKAVNQPLSFQEMISQGIGNWNPGDCWVSTKCYQPQNLIDNYITPAVESLAKNRNLFVFYRTAVIATERDSTTGDITSLVAVQRFPLNASTEWDRLLSESLPDWYSSSDSPFFKKMTMRFSGSVFVDATEFGDVLITGGLQYAQGAEVPLEANFTTNPSCGQAFTIPFYISAFDKNGPSPTPQQNVPNGSNESYPFSLESFSWPLLWTYRRSLAVGNGSEYAVNIGDISNQNFDTGNDFLADYLFLTNPFGGNGSTYCGGVNLSTLSAAEQRAYGWFHYFVDKAPASVTKEIALLMNYSATGTNTGLAKLPYLRDTRRSIGLGLFRLFYGPLDGEGNPDNSTLGYRFHDTVALGNYNDDTHKLLSCTLPPYVKKHETKPYFIPFRSLTHFQASNLLVAGKTIAQTFHANSATRLHPSEWTTGVAAGVAAVLMAENSWSSLDVYNHIETLQSILTKDPSIRQPLDWTGC